jgi:hypothetical protein
MRRRMRLFVMCGLLLAAVAVAATPTGRIWARQQDDNVRSLMHTILLLQPRFAAR